MKHLKSASPSKYCIVSTNGELLDKFNLADIRESGLDLLAISLSAHSKEVYETINCGLDYDRVTRNVSRVLSDPQLKQRTRLNFVVTEQNMHDVDRAGSAPLSDSPLRQRRHRRRAVAAGAPQRKGQPQVTPRSL